MMKALFAGLFSGILLATFAAQAAPSSGQIKATLEAQKSCGSFVRFDDANVYVGFAHSVDVAPLNGASTFQLTTTDLAIDFVTVGQTAYILTPTSIEEWNLESKTRTTQYPTTATPGALGDHQQATAFALYKNTLIISHGRLGLTMFDLQTKKVTATMPLIARQAPLESMATGVSVQGHLAYITLDSYSLAAPGEENRTFRGVVIVDMETQQQVKELSSMDPGVTSIATDARRAIVSFGGEPIWKFDIDSLRTTRSSEIPAPLNRVWAFPSKGHPTGSAAMDDQFYYTCFSTPPPQGGLMIRAPLALDRASLKLD